MGVTATLRDIDIYVTNFSKLKALLIFLQRTHSNIRKYLRGRASGETFMQRIQSHANLQPHSNPHARRTTTQPLWRRTRNNHSREVKPKNGSLTVPPKHFGQGIMYSVGRKPEIVTYCTTVGSVYENCRKCISHMPHLKKSLSP